MKEHTSKTELTSYIVDTRLDTNCARLGRWIFSPIFGKSAVHQVMVSRHEQYTVTIIAHVKMRSCFVVARMSRLANANCKTKNMHLS